MIAHLRWNLVRRRRRRRVGGSQKTGGGRRSRREDGPWNIGHRLSGRLGHRRVRAGGVTGGSGVTSGVADGLEAGVEVLEREQTLILDR